jgi:hypothetical protein
MKEGNAEHHSMSFPSIHDIDAIIYTQNRAGENSYDYLSDNLISHLVKNINIINILLCDSVSYCGKCRNFVALAKKCRTCCRFIEQKKPLLKGAE